jgi:hypothetical protein
MLGHDPPPHLLVEYIAVDGLELRLVIAKGDVASATNVLDIRNAELSVAIRADE